LFSSLRFSSDALIAEDPLRSTTGDGANVDSQSSASSSVDDTVAGSSSSNASSNSNGKANGNGSGNGNGSSSNGNGNDAGTTFSGLSKSSKAYEAVALYRAQFRAQDIPESYSAWVHLLRGIVLWSGSTATLACWVAGGPRAMVTNPAQALCVLLAFGLANFGEWYAHRYKLHNPLVHTRHSHTHHRFFTRRVMEFDAFNKDAHAIFFPERAPMILMLVGVPVLSLLPTLLFGLAAGASFACTLALYYLSYEVLHLAYHAHPDSFLGRLPGVPALRLHHQVHHEQALMGKWNFNITWPSQFILCRLLPAGRSAPVQRVAHSRVSCLSVLVLVLPLRSLRLSLQHNVPRRIG
jgi:hypothetical protein